MYIHVYINIMIEGAENECVFFLLHVSYKAFLCFCYFVRLFLYASCVSVFLCVLIFIDVDTVRACLHMCVCVCARACMRSCLLLVRACVCVCVCVCKCVFISSLLCKAALCAKRQVCMYVCISVCICIHIVHGYLL